MNIQIVARGPLILVGMGYFGNPFSKASAWDADNEIGSLWKRFMAFLSTSSEQIRDRTDQGERWYELHINTSESKKTGRFEIFVGVEVGSLSALPIACSAKIIPATEYAVLTAKGEEIACDWLGKLYKEIIPSLGRCADETYCIDFYDTRFKGMDRLIDSEVDYYIPLLPLAER